MTDIIIGLIVIAVLALLAGWLTRRAWRSPRLWVRWVGGLLAGLLTLLLIAVLVLGVIGWQHMFAPQHVSMSDVKAGGTPEQVKRGEHLATVLCVDCHSENGQLPLAGGENLSADAGIPLGNIYAPNLTPGSDIKDWTDADLFRAIRTGVDDEGRVTAMASVAGPRLLSDEDTLAVIAYLRQSPAVEHETPAFRPSLLMALLSGAGLVPANTPAAVTPVTAPPAGATAEYGEYVAAYMDCRTCHGAKLDGKVAPPFPAGPNLQADFYAWSKDQFVNEVQAHAASVKPHEVMPWKDIAQLDSVELEALYLYLHQVATR